MTNKEIKREAVGRIKRDPERVMGGTLNMFSLIVIIVLIETLIWSAYRLISGEYHLTDLDYYRESKFRLIFPAVRYFIYFTACSAQMFLIRRSFIDFEDGGRLIERYISGHIRKVVIPGIKRSIQLTAYKLLVLSPITVGIYGVRYFMNGEHSDEINLFGLMCFMLSIGFTIVWAGVCAHYFMSLSLVKYIGELNPRANFFDACDLSVKLMEGKHWRLISFYASMLPIMLTSVAVYPVFLTFPYYLECRTILSRQLMGDYWQDKLSAMARRWEKQINREN